jgi:hypothetical protein
MRQAFNRPEGGPGALLWDLLTFERLMTNTVIHLVYWAGLGIILLAAFGSLGAAVGVAIRDPLPWGVLLAIPVLIAGLLVTAVMVLLWRSFCEFYVTIFKISEDLAVLRSDVEAERRRAAGPAE